MRVAILTVSDAGARGERADTSGDALEQWARGRGYVVAAARSCPTTPTQIVDALIGWCDRDDADLVLTTGGTGLASARRHARGDARRARARSAGHRRANSRAVDRQSFPRAALSRGVAGTRKRTLIVNLPARPAA